jgi:hypothetical protein
MATATTDSISKVKALRDTLDPADFRFCCEYYLGHNPDIADAYGHEHFPDDGPCHEDMGKCDHCGTCHTYGALYRRTDGSYFAVGRNCAGKFFDFSSKSAYYLAQAHNVEVNREQRNVALAKAEAFLAGSIAGLADALDFDHHICEQIKGKLYRWGSISDAQVDLVFKIANQPPREKEPEPVAIPTELTDGRQVFTGVVLGLKWVDSEWGGGTKIIFQDDRGFKLWGSRTANFEKGNRVSFVARIEISKKDACFGFFSRPTKGKRLDSPQTDDDA